MKKIVYIEDDRFLGDILIDLLRLYNYDVIHFDNHQDTINFFNNNDIVKLVIIDYRMPDGTGDQLAKKLPSSLKKILLTGELNLDQEIINAGIFDKIIIKPWKQDELINIINLLSI